MNKTERIVSEYTQIETTDWWVLYLSKVADYRKQRGEMLETCGVERVPYLQGEITALKFVAGLPERILRELADNKS
jgi:hypothetical protein